MSLTPATLIDHQALSKVDHLHFVSSVLMNEFLGGHHHSVLYGYGMEFAQYKEYQVGDDWRLVDWKQYARKEKYYLRQSEFESKMSLRIIIDASSSMNADYKGFSKFDYAKIIAATLAHLAGKQGDLLYLQLIKEGQVQGSLSAANSLKLIDLLYLLTTTTTQGKWVVDPQYTHPFSQFKDREVVVVLTDHFEEKDELQQSIQSLKRQNNEVIVCQLLHPQELEFSYPETAVFEDLETAERVIYSGKAATKRFKIALEQYMEEIENNYLQKGITYLLMNTADPIHQLLRTFLNKKSALK